MKLRIATTWASRVRGLLGPNCLLDAEEVLLLVPCRDIHTVGMKFPIDVAFIDRQGSVCLAYKNLPPAKRLYCPEACAVLERVTPCDERSVSGEVPLWAAEEVRDSWFHTGERLDISSGSLLFDDAQILELDAMLGGDYREELPTV